MLCFAFVILVFIGREFAVVTCFEVVKVEGSKDVRGFIISLYHIMKRHQSCVKKLQ